MSADALPSRAAPLGASLALLAALGLLGLTAAPSAAGIDSTSKCGSLRITASKVTYRATAIRAHLASCAKAKRIVRKWIRKGFTSSHVEGPWTCAYAPGARNPDCIAGKNGFIHFKLKPRGYLPGSVRGG
jgi:hypothetical protein